MRQRLILHIGTHKTGSTTIQNYFYLNRLWLRPMGVHYPRPLLGPMFYVNNHRDLRDTARLEGKPKSAVIHPQLGPHAARLAHYVNAIKEARAPIAILSCEGWSSVLNRYAQRLAALQNRFDVKVIAFMRRPDHWAEAFYRQRVANISHRETASFHEFVAQAPMQTYLFDRAQLFGWWADAFGTQNITVIPFEPAVRGFDLIGRFCDAAGISDGVKRRLLFRRSRANPTLSRSNAEALRRINLAGGTPQRPRTTVQSGEPSYFSGAERAELLARAAPDLQRITELYVKDGRKSMFEDEPETFTPAAQ